MNRFHCAMGHRFKRTQRAGVQRFSFQWRGTYATAFAARPYLEADLIRDEERDELIRRDPRQARRRGYWF